MQGRYYFFGIAVLVVLIGFVLRFYRLSEIPNGLYPDETAIGYNAYSILMTGKDEYGESWPLYFKSFDDYKLPVYIYSSAFLMNFLDASEYTVRLPSAISGTLSIVVLFLLVYELSSKKWLALLASLFLALNPWHLFFSRAGYEVNVATFFILTGVYLFILSINRKNNLFLLSLSTIPFLLSIYTYNVTRLLAPVILISLFIFYYKKLMPLKWQLFIPVALFIFGALPFLVSFITLQGEEGFSSHRDGLIIGNFTRAQLIETRSYFVGLPDIVEKVFLNYYVLLGIEYLKNMVLFFSSSFYFVVGSDKPNQNLSHGLSMFYYFDFFLIIVGIYQGIKKRVAFLYPFYVWLLVVFVIGSMVTIVPNGTRTYPVVIPLVVFSAYGMLSVLRFLMDLKNRNFRLLGLILLTGVISYSVIFYFLSYFVRFPVELAKDWKSEDKKLYQFISGQDKMYKKIVFDESSEVVYTNFLFFSKYPPQNHHSEAVYEQKGLVATLVKTGKYEFRKINWSDDLREAGVLLITGEGNEPVGIEPIKEFYYPTRPVAIYYDRRIGQFPVTEIAYRVYSSNMADSEK